METLSALPITQRQASNLSCEIVTDFARLDELRADWDRLWRSDPRAEVFQNYAWVRAFWSAYGRDLEMCSIVVRERNRTVGILPLALRAGTLQFLGSPRSDYNDIICEESTALAVLECAIYELLRLPTAWKRCRLENVSEASRIMRYLPSLPPRLRSHVQAFVACPCPTIMLKNGEILKKSLRYHIRRQTKKIQRLGALTFRRVENAPEIEMHLERFFRQHMERQAFRQEPSLFADEQSRQYYRAMAYEPSLQPWVSFEVLEFDSQPIAYHFGFQVNGKCVWYKPSFAIDYFDFSPGELLLNEILKSAVVSGAREVDLTIGDEPYKSHFATHVRYNFLIVVARHPDRVDARINFRMLQCKQWIKEKPALLQLAREAKRRALQTLQQLRLQVGRQGIIRAGLGALRLARRKAIFSADRLVLARINRQDFRGEPEMPSEVVVQRGTLGELALASVPYADLIGPKELQMVRGWLKNGSELYMVRRNGKFVQFALACESAQVPVDQNVQRTLAIHEPAFVVHRLWTVPDSKDHAGLFELVIQRLAALARQRGRDLYVFVRQKDFVESHMTGAALKLRLTALTVFRKLRFESVRNSM